MANPKQMGKSGGAGGKKIPGFGAKLGKTGKAPSLDGPHSKKMCK